MHPRYKENSFSTENFPILSNAGNKEKKENKKVSITNLINKINIEKRKKKKKNFITLSVFLLGLISLALINFILN